MKTLVLTLCLVVFTFGQAFGKTLQVPQQFKTIQEAINVSADGDLILVAEGHYLENINFLGKAITVASHFVLDQNKLHIKRTIIDGSKPGNPDFASVVSFISGEDSNSVLCGFTITGGTGMKLQLPGFPEMRLGGGIICFASGAKISHNIIEKNIVKGSPWCIGGGLDSAPPEFPLPLVVENNIFRENEVYGETMADGGGLSNYLPGRIYKNEFINNLVFCKDGIASGGGLSSFTALNAQAGHVLIADNIVSNNKAISTTGGSIGGIAGGMEIWGFNFMVRNNIVSHNIVSSAVDDSYGAGVVLDVPNETVILKNNVISYNTFEGSGACLGGALAIWDGDANITNNVLSHNQATKGGGIYITIENTVSRPLVVNNTISDNKATVAGGGLYSHKSKPTVMNSILWQNHAPVDPQISVDGGSVSVSYCDIQGSWPGTGNIDADPVMHNSSFMLAAISPCVDGGNVLAMHDDPESPFRPGFAQLPARGTVRNDMGAFGGPACAGWHEFAGELNSEPQHLSARNSIHTGTFPNPFNSVTRIQFSLYRQAAVKLVIYNTLGQKVAILLDKPLQAGEHSVSWDAGYLASGLYFYALSVDGVSTIQKLVLLK